MKISEQVAEILLSVNAVTLRPEEPFTFSSGIKSPVYSDHRQLMGYPKERRIIAGLLADEVKKIGVPAFVAGTAMGAIPHAAWVADILDIPMVYVRDKPKKHGKQNLVEGYYEKGQTAIIIEDLISTGQSSIGTVNGLRNVGCIVNHIVGITTYTMQKSVDNFQSVGVTLQTLTDFPTIVEVAIRRGRMKESDRALVLDWIKDPASWGK